MTTIQTPSTLEEVAWWKVLFLISDIADYL